MKDLYARLNLSPEVSPQAIRSRLKNVRDSQLKRAAQEILLRPRRRDVYDRNHRTLQMIGELRQELDLTDTANWKETGVEDFVSSSGSSQSSTSSSTNTESSTNQRSSTSEGEESTAGSGNRDPYAETTGRTASSGTSIVGSILGVWADAMEGAYGCVVTVVARFAMLIMLFGSCAIVGQMCEMLEPTQESQTQVETADSPSNQPDGSELTPETESPTQDRTEQRSRKHSFSVSPKPLPGNGTWWKYTSEELIAPLRISVSEGHHYYVKVTDAITDERVLTVFIRSGRTIEVDVPTGSYNLKYAIGDTWYGRQHLFGPETEYLEANDTFNFEIDGQRVRGHRIELIVQEGGNLSTSPIPESEF